ncbi:MAG: ATP-binding protein [Candidatus Aminicenantales bacterium]
MIAILVLLAVFGTVAYFMLSKNLYRNLDEALQTRVTELEGSIKLVNGQISFEQKFNDLVFIYNADGALLQRLGPNIGFPHIEKIVQQALLGQSSFLTATTTEGQNVRMYGAPFNVDSRTRIAVIVGRLPQDIQNMLAIFRRVIIYSALAVLLLAGVGGMFLTNRTLKPVDHITDIARGIGESDLSRRIEIQSDDEMGRLASTLNGMIARLEEAFNRQRQFAADASHELRTPLAVIQAESSLALDKKRTQAEYRKSLEVVSQEVAYMSEIIGKLLQLVRGDASSEQLNLDEVNLRDLWAELTSDLEALAQEKGLQFLQGPMDNLSVMGDKLTLRQLFLNILDNAIRYTPSGGSITGSLIKKEENAVVSISDTGVGISAEHLPFIFDRFYRVDKARSRAEGGTGLGLAIASSIAKMHGGYIEIESQVGKGSSFHIILPLLVAQVEK